MGLQQSLQRFSVLHQGARVLRRNLLRLTLPGPGGRTVYNPDFALDDYIHTKTDISFIKNTLFGLIFSCMEDALYNSQVAWLKILEDGNFQEDIVYLVRFVLAEPEDIFPEGAHLENSFRYVSLPLYKHNSMIFSIRPDISYCLSNLFPKKGVFFLFSALLQKGDSLFAADILQSFHCIIFYGKPAVIKDCNKIGRGSRVADLSKRLYCRFLYEEIFVRQGLNKGAYSPCAFVKPLAERNSCMPFHCRTFVIQKRVIEDSHEFIRYIQAWNFTEQPDRPDLDFPLRFL